MKIFLLALTILVFSPGVAPRSWAAETNSWVETCDSWNTMADRVHTALVLGWLLGIEAADSLTSDEIASKLWPKGHRVGSVVIELDAVCQERGNGKREIRVLLMEIAKRLNGIAK